MKRLFLILMIILAVATSAPRGALAQPRAFNYQGFVSELDGTPLQGSYPLTFRIYSTATQATPNWMEAHTAVSMVDGVFSVLLGSSTPLPDALWEMDEVWIGVTVGSTGTEIAPRLRVTSVPWAIRAAVADSAVVAGSSGGGGVTQVDTGPGLEGGPITTSGTIGVAAGGIAGSMLAPNSVTGDKVLNGSLAGGDIAANTITGTQIGTNAVGSEEIAPASVGTAEVLDNSLTGADLATNAVGADEVQDDSLTSVDLADEPGIAYFRKSEWVDSPISTEIIYMTESITVPRAGFIQASVKLIFLISHTTGSGSNPIVSISTTPEMDGFHSSQWYIPSSYPSGVRMVPIAWTTVFPVSQGTHTFYIISASLSGHGNEIANGELTLLFVPTAYGPVATESKNLEVQP